MIRIDHRHTPNGDGWSLALRRTIDDQALVKGRNPLLIVPGYGMNSFIFGFHPRGVSMEAYLAGRGFEVWSVDLRAQGDSRCEFGSHRYGFDDLVLKDVFSAVHCVADTTETGACEVDIIGCSLGASMMFAYVACVPEHRTRRLVNMGGPVHWVRINPLLRLAFASPELLGVLPIKGARQLAGFALPMLSKVPKLLSVYIHPEIVDMKHAPTLVRTVENPNRHVNRDLARWIKNRDLIVDGKNVCEAVKTLTNPLLTVIASADGIVPRETVIWPHENIKSERRDILEVGTAAVPIAHADMFISDLAPDLVFRPLADWLAE